MQSRQYVNFLRLGHCFRSRVVYAPYRLFSATAPQSSNPETAIVPCRNNGAITLDIHRPSSSSSSGNTIDSPNPSILLYLPRGPIFSPKSSRTNLIDEHEIASALAEASGLTVVQINYRLSATNRFPTPIHDVILGYDWVVENFANNVRGGKHGTQLPIGVCGELLGGTLSLSLALAECKLPAPEATSRPTMQRTADPYGDDTERGRVVAVSANNPIVDWVLPFGNGLIANTGNSPTSARSKSRKTSLDEDSLQNIGLSADSREDSKRATSDDLLSFEALTYAQNSLFYPGRLADRFDPFASPILFLRTPGVAPDQDMANHSGDSPALTDYQDEDFYSVDDNQSSHNDTHDKMLAGRTEAPHLNQSWPMQVDLDKNRVVNETADDTIVIPWLEDDSTPTMPSDKPSTPSTPSTPESTKTKRPYKPRKLPRKYPPASMLPVSFPAVRLSTGIRSPLRQQSVEMANLLRRAFGRFQFPEHYASGAPKNQWGHGNLGKEGLESLGPQPNSEYVEQRIAQQIELHLRGNGIGLWCQRGGNEREGRNGKEQEEIRTMGEWFRTALQV